MQAADGGEAVAAIAVVHRRDHEGEAGARGARGPRRDRLDPEDARISAAGCTGGEPTEHAARRDERDARIPPGTRRRRVAEVAYRRSVSGVRPGVEVRHRQGAVETAVADGRGHGQRGPHSEACAGIRPARHGRCAGEQDQPAEEAGAPGVPGSSVKCRHRVPPTNVLHWIRVVDVAGKLAPHLPRTQPLQRNCRDFRRLCGSESQRA